MRFQQCAANSLLIITVLVLAGCNRRTATSDATESNPIVAEGIIYSVEYKRNDGATSGFTRLNIAQAVPGDNGSWNVDAYGRLTNEYLIITYPQKEYLGPRVIPAHRLVDIQFGSGGIKNVNEGDPAPAE